MVNQFDPITLLVATAKSFFPPFGVEFNISHFVGLVDDLNATSCLPLSGIQFSYYRNPG